VRARRTPNAPGAIRSSSPGTRGVYLAGGFNKAPEAGNRFVIIRYESEAAFDKFWNGGGKT
jgi:hypothetical protein